MYAYVQNHAISSIGQKRGGPALWTVSSSMVTELSPILFLSRPSLLWASGMCTWGLWSKLNFGQLPLVYAPRNTSKNVYSHSWSLPFPSPPTHQPILHLPLSLPPYSLRSSILFCPVPFSLLWFWFALRLLCCSHTLSITHYHIPHKPASWTQFCFLSIIHSSSLFCFFLLVICLLPRKFLLFHLGVFLVLHTHLILTPLRRLSVINGNLKYGNTWNPLKLCRRRCHRPCVVLPRQSTNRYLSGSSLGSLKASPFL